MVLIQVDGEDKTGQISDWQIYWDEKYSSLRLKCVYPSQKTYTLPMARCRVSPTRELGEVWLQKPQGAPSQKIAKVEIYGERYAAVYYLRSKKPYIYNMDNVSFFTPTTLKDEPIFRYFSDVAKARKNRETSANKNGEGDGIYGNVLRQMEKLFDCAQTALYAYCTQNNGVLAPPEAQIYPFGLNESQLLAVEQAFSRQISVIEGPPGTGKTQTILNILANILLRGQTVAVVSNNNAAVDNIYEKLEKSGLGYLVAKLGSSKNRENFFENLPSLPEGEADSAPTMQEIQALLTRVKQHLHDHNRAAQLQVELDELRVEREHLKTWLTDNEVQADISLEKYGFSPRKVADLLAYLAYLGERRIRLRDRFELLRHFRIFRTRPFAREDARQAVFHVLQLHYYDKAVQEKEAELHGCQESLKRGEFEASLDELKTGSMQYLKKHLHRRSWPSDKFDYNTYQNSKKFQAFIRRFPIIGSGTHSIVNSLAADTILDYVIIDEASMQDIIPGILAMGCAKNLVIVGDSRQLAHIPVRLDLPARDDAYDCERYSLLDSCIGVFKEALPRTLLKEHYRCHPMIIQFCNQQFYDNALVPMTRDEGKTPMRLVVTAKGNHARGNTNLREVESLLKVLEDNGDAVGFDDKGRGFIAPFRAQVKLSDTYLPEDFVKDTVHKFQGRECDEIVFSTVLDKKNSNQKHERLSFVDDPRMIHVAVSRAKNGFTLVTGDDVFTGNNGHIAALIRYITYYVPDEQIIRAPVVSAFDLLYAEYDQSQARLGARLRAKDSHYKSEQIVAQLLREALSEPSCQALTWHSQVNLDLIASAQKLNLTKAQQIFMSRSTCDFVIYYKVGKVPVGVIEVDGGSHQQALQMQHDDWKNEILEKSGIPILRLRTIDSGIEEKIEKFISQWAN